MRWGPVWKRRFLPRSRTWDFPPSTAGMIPASHARRRASEAEITPPVDRPAASSPPRSDSSVMVTTTVAATPPPVAGSRSTG